MTASSFEKVIAERGRLVYTNVGDSMYPLIKPRDLLIIDAVNRPLRLWDVPLYKRDNGQYVLHRIVKIKNGSYVMCGDNRCTSEYGITDRHIIGVLTGIVRDGRTLPVTMPEHKSILFRKIKRYLKKLRKQEAYHGT